MSEAWAIQVQLAKQRAINDRMLTFLFAPLTTGRTSALLIGIFIHLRLDDRGLACA